MELRLTFASLAELERECSANLTFGRAFVPTVERPELFSEVVLGIVGPAPVELAIPCRVVMVLTQENMRGVALEFLKPDQSVSALRQLLDTTRAPSSDESKAPAAAEVYDQDDPLEADDEGPEEEAGPGTRGKNLAAERQARLRNLPLAERLKIAHGPVMGDRVLLERIYGTAVWDALLRNPKITVPEVARIARKGSLPRPLLELIVDNEGWIHQAQIRRALLSNPRLSHDAALRVLRALPARELKLVPHQTAYPSSVRQAAHKLLKGA